MRHHKSITHHWSVVGVRHADLLLLDRIARARGTLSESRSTDKQRSAGDGGLDGLAAGNALHLHAHALAELIILAFRTKMYRRK